MKKLVLILMTVISLNSFGSFTIEIVNPCVNVSSVMEEVDVFAPATLAEVVRFFFPAFEIPYQATETSIIHIFHTPVGSEAVEVVNNSHYRYYGWCYEVDGIMPNVTMDRYLVDPGIVKHIRWFYGYAELIHNEWVKYCEPLYNHPEQFICAGLFN